MSPVEQQQRILMVFTAHPWEWLTERQLAEKAGVQRPCYETIYRLMRVHPGTIISRKGPQGGYCYNPKEQTMSSVRGTGRSYGQLEALSDGGVYIIADSSSVWYYRDLLAKMGRDPFKVDFIGLPDMEQQLLGRSIPDLDMDHFAREIATPRQAELFWYLRDRLRVPS